MTAANPQQQLTLFSKYSTEVRPPVMVRHDERIRSMKCPFEEIAESEEEDIQLPQPTQPEGRSPFAVAFESPFVERRPASPQSLTSASARKFPVPRLCWGFSGPTRRQAPSVFGSLSPDRHVAGSDFLTLPPIPETASS
ncbi:unnamed protein product [Cylicocyclus nassatus]|uniref:Uncharacterized protein n=1 Tax=Cylicocyclus nassatus TaxID=53992 RepID=A0AA36HDL5_CYLNA|nr:unnamed protein product [Cylicocyclus nassatus]